MVHNVIIIGSGPAGYTAALYTSRANLEPLLFSGDEPGGQLMITTDVENYPGFPEGITGPEMMQLFRKQAERFGTTVRDEKVTALDVSERPFTVQAAGQTYRAKTVILATGASAKWLGLPAEQALMGHGVSACATCDGFFFRDKTVVVVGGGDTAMEEAGFLTRFCSKVYVAHRRDALRASKIMQDRVLGNPKVEMLWNTVIEDIHDPAEKRVTAVTLRNTKSGETQRMPVDGVFVAIGHEPNSHLVRGVLDTDDLGYVITEPRSTRTKIPGLFACGDLVDRTYRQAVTAAGSGCMAAIDAERFLESEGH
ncbi:MAG: thioredoxin-disulfide reductase [Fimbriimonadia bacterium]|jgi:thioredoxin reductase (NADPH)